MVESMNLRTPIVARLQGTNMEMAHKLINDSGLKIFSVEDLQSAAEKSVQFSKVVKMGMFLKTLFILKGNKGTNRPPDLARTLDVGVSFDLGL